MTLLMQIGLEQGISRVSCLRNALNKYGDQGYF